jgi:hypothetical protein
MRVERLQQPRASPAASRGDRWLPRTEGARGWAARGARGGGRTGKGSSPPPRLEGRRPTSPPTWPPGSARWGTRGGKRERRVRETRMSEEPVAAAGLPSSGWETMASRSGRPTAGAVRAASSYYYSSSSICRPGGAADTCATPGEQGWAEESTTGRGRERERRRQIQTPGLALLLRPAPPPRLLEVNGEIRGVRRRRRSAREAAATGSSSAVGTSSAMGSTSVATGGSGSNVSSSERGAHRRWG